MPLHPILGHEEREAIGLGQSLVDAGRELQKGAVGVDDHQDADQPAASPEKASAEPVGKIPEFVGAALDSAPGRFGKGNVAAVGQRKGDRGGGDAGEAGDVGDGDALFLALHVSRLPIRLSVVFGGRSCPGRAPSSVTFRYVYTISLKYQYLRPWISMSQLIYFSC